MKIAYQGRISAIIERPVTLPDGKARTFEYAVRPPGVRILVFSGEKILLTSEWRDEIKDYDLRLPGGKVYDTFAEFLPFMDLPSEVGAAAHLAAQRELREETGIDVSDADIKLLKVTECGATISWQLHYFLVEAPERTLRKRIETHEGELIEPRWVSPSELLEHCIKGNVREDRTAAVIIQWLAKTHPQLLKGGLGL